MTSKNQRSKAAVRVSARFGWVWDKSFRSSGSSSRLYSLGAWGVGTVRIASGGQGGTGRRADRRGRITVGEGTAFGYKTVQGRGTGTAVPKNSKVPVSHVVRKDVNDIGCLFHDKLRFCRLNSRISAVFWRIHNFSRHSCPRQVRTGRKKILLPLPAVLPACAL